MLLPTDLSWEVDCYVTQVCLLSPWLTLSLDLQFRQKEAGILSSHLRGSKLQNGEADFQRLHHHSL